MNKKTYIIAEAGVNHNGSLSLAREMVVAAKESGADAIKFQTFKTDKVISKKAPKASYQCRNTGINESQYEMVKKLELSFNDFENLFMCCKSHNIEFLSTPFDNDSLDFLADKLNVSVIKIPSGEINNAPFLLSIAKKKKPVILSTGMSTISEIEDALAILTFGFADNKDSICKQNILNYYSSIDEQNNLKEKISLLHCTTEYPTPYDEINLRAINTLKIVFGLKVGLSDHSEGITIPIAAVGMGAEIIEKHFTLDKKFEGPDHKASLNPVELKDMVSAIRNVNMALGNGFKYPSKSEMKNRIIARRSLIAAKAIFKGERFSIDNIDIKRPGTGISPMNYWNVLGTIAQRDYNEDEIIE